MNYRQKNNNPETLQEIVQYTRLGSALFYTIDVHNDDTSSYTCGVQYM
jgi:hypothetical protein